MMRRFLLSSVAVVACLASCNKNTRTAPEPTSEGLVGTWQLVERQCYCVPGPPPNESVVFSPTEFSFFANGQLRYHGTYAPATVTVCGMAAPAPGLHFSSAQPQSGLPEVQYTLTGDQLILDYGGPCDAPRDTYKRVK